MGVVHAVFENGVFRPTEPVDLPERCEVVFEPRMVPDRSPEAHRARVHALLGRSIETGETDMADRHSEPLP
jgi:predicted DNA-binding antitoxin AbrB/MazE fold protein